MHICRQDNCQCEKNEEGQDICCITGCCIKMLNFSDKEFLDTVCFYSTPPLQQASTKHGHRQQNAAAASAAEAGAEGCDDDDDAKRQKLQHQKHAHGQVAMPAPPSTISLAPVSSSLSSSSASSSSSLPLRCSVNKKNRYRSWVHSRMQLNHGGGSGGSSVLMQQKTHSMQQQHQQQKIPPTPAARNRVSSFSSSSSSPATTASLSQQQQPQLLLQVPSGFSLAEEAENVRSLIEMYVWDVLCSRKWSESMKMEEKKVDAKKKMLMLKAFKFLKTCRSSESDLISIPEAVCMVIILPIIFIVSLNHCHHCILKC